MQKLKVMIIIVTRPEIIGLSACVNVLDKYHIPCGAYWSKLRLYTKPSIL